MNFNDAKFANAVNRIYFHSNARLDKPTFKIGRVEWVKETHSRQTALYAYQCDTHLVAEDNGWSFLHVSEIWRDPAGKPIRSGHWGRLIKGKKPDVMAWVKARLAAIEK